MLFVSHNMAAVGSLCSRILYLKNGQVAASGPSSEIIPLYLESERSALGSDAQIPDDEQRGYVLRPATRQMTISCGEPLTIAFELECPIEHASVTAGLVLYNLFDVPIVGASSKVQGISGSGQASRWQVSCELGEIPLNAGTDDASILGRERRPRLRFVLARCRHPRGAGGPVRLGQQGARVVGAFLLEAGVEDPHEPRELSENFSG